MVSVYVIKSQVHHRFYVGMSEDVNRRLKEHNNGKTKSTKGFAPWEIVFIEEYQTRAEARKREKWLKSGIGIEFIKAYWSRSSVG